jgi:hypothetical protein
VSPVERARRALVDCGLAVKAPAEAIGPCKAPYLVVYDGGVAPSGRKVGLHIIGVAAFVPLERRAELEQLIQSAQAAMAKLDFIPRGSPAGEAIDEGFRAHTMSIEYAALRAL